MATLGSLRGEIRDICDISGSSFHLDFDINKYINSSIEKLQSIMINSFDGSSFIGTGSYDITLTTGTQDYSIADLNPWKVVTVSLNDGSYDYQCHPASWGDQHDHQLTAPILSNDDISPYRHILYGNMIKMVPSPATGHTLKLWYVPRWADLTADSDAINTQIPAAYLDYVTYDVAIKIKVKAEEPIGELASLKQDVERLIREDAENRITNQIRYAPNVDDNIYPYHRFRN